MRTVLLLSLFVLSFTTAGWAQVSYHHYYDSSTEWRIYAEGVNLVWASGWRQYRTVYFDGDTLIGGNWYYRGYSVQLDSTTYPYAWPPNPKGPLGPPVTIVDTTYFGPFFTREDSTHKVWNLDKSTGLDVLEMDWSALPSVGDTFRYYANTNCTVGFVDSIYLGNFPLKRVRPVDNSDSIKWTRGYVEGIGNTFNPCGQGIENNSWYVCYSSLGASVQLSHIVQCAAFLEPVRNYHSGYNSGDSTDNPTFISQAGRLSITVSPNPVNKELCITLPDQGFFELAVLDQLGRQVLFSTSQERIKVLDVSNLSRGIYFLVLTSNKKRGYVRFLRE